MPCVTMLQKVPILVLFFCRFSLLSRLDGAQLFGEVGRLKSNKKTRKTADQFIFIIISIRRDSKEGNVRAQLSWSVQWRGINEDNSLEESGLMRCNDKWP